MKLIRKVIGQVGLGAMPLVMGVLATLGLISVILRLEANVVEVQLQDITLASQEAAITARERLLTGESVSQIAISLGLEETSYNATRSVEKRNSSRLRLPREATDEMFSGLADNTIIGPYETRTGWYVAKIEQQSFLGLGNIYDFIDERVWSNSPARANVINFWLPLFLCSCGLLLTFSAGLWNIGVEGQMAMGAVGATGVALFMDLPRNQQLFTELFMAGAAGGSWALLTAILRTRGGVNEIFGGVAMNFIASNFSAYLLVGPWAPPGGTGSSTELFPAKSLLPKLEDYNLSPTTLWIAAVCFTFVLLTFTGSRWGLQLRAMGKNERSARMLGVPTERNIWLAMTLCGIMAGLAGAHIVLFTQKKMAVNISGGIGFLGLLVVLLASIRVVWVPLISLTFALLFYSGGPLQIRFQDLDDSLVGVSVGVLVLMVLILDGVRQRILARLQRARPPTITQEVAHGPSAD